MRLVLIVLLGAVVSIMSLGIAPLALATTPADATIGLSPPSCVPPSCQGFIVTFSVTQNAQCPVGGFVVGSVTQNGPLGSKTFSVFNPSDPSQPLPCGVSLTEQLGVHPVAPLSACDYPFVGTYTFEFSGTTHDVTGAPVATFDVTSTYTVSPCASVPSVPQFPFGIAALFGLAIPLLFVLRRRGLASRPRPT